MRMLIEPIASVHEIRFREWIDGDDSSRAFIARSAPSFANSSKLFHKLCNMAERGDFWAWVQRTDEDKIIAYAELKQSAKVSKSELELIYVVSEAWRSKGVATSFVRGILDHGGWDKERKVVAYVNLTNIASIKVLLGNKFVKVPDPFTGARYERGAYA